MKKPKKQQNSQFIKYFGPLLNALRELGGSGRPDEVAERIAIDLNLSDDLQNEVTQTGQSRYKNQVDWARYYLAQYGLIDSSRRGIWTLTPIGQNTILNEEESKKNLPECLAKISRQKTC